MPKKSSVETVENAEIAVSDCIGSVDSWSDYSMSALFCCLESGTDPINNVGL